MRRIKLTASYRHGDKIIQKVMMILVTPNKEQDVFDFEAFVNSKADELKLAVISSNVNVVTWTDDVPTDKIAQISSETDEDSLVVTSPRLPDDNENIMVFCPTTMEKMIQSGKFAQIYKEVRDTYESMYWSGSGNVFDLIIYFKDGKTSRTQWGN
jgi:hypothetical protein